VLAVSLGLTTPISAQDPTPANSTVPYDSQNLTFHVTDFGINQPWTERLKVGDPFNGLNRVFPELDKYPGSQLVVPMPSDYDLKILSETQLKDRIASQLLDCVHDARTKGITEFEIQLVQHVNSAGYFDPTRQDLVRRFAKAAYAAVGTVVEHEQPSSQTINVDAILGSNGTEAWSQSVSSWSSYASHIKSVTLVNGRAWVGPTDAAIKALGHPEKVLVLVSYGDLPAHDLSIAKFETVQRLKAQYPTMNVLLLEPLDSSKRVFGTSGGSVVPFSSHVLSMTDPDAKFRVFSVSTNGKNLLGEFTSRDLRSVSEASSFKAPSHFGEPEWKLGLSSYSRSSLESAPHSPSLEASPFKIPSAYGELPGTLDFAAQGWSLFDSSRRSVEFIRGHSADPASDWERLSLGANLGSASQLIKILPENELFGPLGALLSTAIPIGEDVRASVMRDRAQRLVFSLGGPLRFSDFREQKETEEGFAFSGEHVSGLYGWKLDHTSDLPFEHNSFSRSWAETFIVGARQSDGSVLSGTFLRSELRVERGASVWSLFEPTETTISQRTSDRYHVSFDGSQWKGIDTPGYGSGWNSNYETRQTREFAPKVPELSPQAPSPPYAETTRKRPPPAQFPPPPCPPLVCGPLGSHTGAPPPSQPAPPSSVNIEPSTRGNSASSFVSSPLSPRSQPDAFSSGRSGNSWPQVKGVLLPVTDLKISTPTERAEFGDMFQSDGKSLPSQHPDQDQFAIALNNRSDDDEFEHDRELGTSAALQAYVREFPSGRHLKDAQTLVESLEYNEALAANSIAALESFLSRFPVGNFSSDASARLRRLRFQYARQAADVEVCKQFLTQYPEGKDSDELRRYLSSIRPRNPH
jgi:hypothetical protein